LSELSTALRPALGLLEISSVAVGVLAGDAMVKRAPVAVLRAGTVHPGKYLVLVGGEVADVEEALEAGREIAGGNLADEVLLPDVHPSVVMAVTGARTRGEGEAVGVFETRTVAALVRAADRGVKGAEVVLRDVRLADELGGKAYCVFRGAVADVEAAIEAAEASLPDPGLLVARVVVPQIHEEMLENLDGGVEWRERVQGGSQ
jgi:microcompartment protein CcmL/EutN